MEHSDCNHDAIFHLDELGRCGACADCRVCDDCGEVYPAADGPCPCVTERAELAEARREADRAAFDAAHGGLDAAVAA